MNPHLLDMMRHTHLLLHQEDLLILRIDLLVMNQLKRGDKEGRLSEGGEQHAGVPVVVPFVLEAL